VGAGAGAAAFVVEQRVTAARQRQESLRGIEAQVAWLPQQRLACMARPGKINQNAFLFRV